MKDPHKIRKILTFGFLIVRLNTMTSTDKITCPNCNKEKTWRDDNPFRPFCSERCKLIDLGEWASDERRIPGAPINPEDLFPDKNEKEE